MRCIYVDDEPQPLVLFKQIFESVFTALTASSVDEALGLGLKQMRTVSAL